MGRRQSSAASSAANNSDGSADDSDTLVVDRRQLEKERRRRRRRRRERRLDIPAFIGGGEDDDVGADPPPAQAKNMTIGHAHDDGDSSIGQDDMMAAVAAARAASSSDARRKARRGSVTSRGSLHRRNSLTLKEQRLLNSSHDAFGDNSLHGDSSGKLTLEHKNAAANNGCSNPTNHLEDHDELASALAILDTYNDQVADPTSETVALPAQDEGGDGWADHHDHQINPRSGVLLERYRYASISDLSKTHSQFTASTNGTGRTGGTAMSSLTGATKATMLSSATNVASSSVYEAFNVLVEEAVEEATTTNERLVGAGEDLTSSPLSNASENNNHSHKYDFAPLTRAHIPSLEESKDSQDSAPSQRQSSANSTSGRSRRRQSTSATTKGDEHTRNPVSSDYRRSSTKSTPHRSPNQRPSIASANHQTNTYPSSPKHHYRRSTLSVDTDTDDDEIMHRRFIAVSNKRQLHPGKIDTHIPSSSGSQRGANCASKSDNLMKDASGGNLNPTEGRIKSKRRRGSVVLSDGEQEADPFDAWFDAYNRLVYGEKEAVDHVESNDQAAAMETGSTQLQDDLSRLSLASLDLLTPRRLSDCQLTPKDLIGDTRPLDSCPPRQSHLYDSLRRSTEPVHQRRAGAENSSSTKSRRNLNSSVGNGVKAVKRIIKRKSADLKRRSTGGKSTGPGNARGDPNAITASSSSASLSEFQQQQQSRRQSSNDIKTIQSTLSQLSASSRRHSAGPAPDAAVHAAAAAAQSTESHKSLGSQKSLDESYGSELEGEDGRNHASFSMGMNALPTNSSFTPRMA